MIFQVNPVENLKKMDDFKVLIKGGFKKIFIILSHGRVFFDFEKGGFQAKQTTRACDQERDAFGGKGKISHGKVFCNLFVNAVGRGRPAAVPVVKFDEVNIDGFAELEQGQGILVP